jgi:hypothetical protein
LYLGTASVVPDVFLQNFHKIAILEWASGLLKEMKNAAFRQLPFLYNGAFLFVIPSADGPLAHQRR